MGRPTIFTPELASDICTQLAQGKSLRSICKSEDMPEESTVRAWASNDYEGFYPQYAKARDIAVDCMADEILDIADAETPDVARDRLKVDTRKWYLSKLAPKKYGEALKLSGDAENPLRHEHSIKPEDKDIIERFMKERA